MKIGEPVFYYRCPECHHVINEDQSIGIACQICGWTSPFEKRIHFKSKNVIKTREPFVDVFDEENCLRIVAELQGVDKEEIQMKLDSKNHLLTISTNVYYKELKLPAYVIDDVKTSFRNNVFEVKMVKKHGS